jgi:hypothetical protein
MNEMTSALGLCSAQSPLGNLLVYEVVAAPSFPSFSLYY